MDRTSDQILKGITVILRDIDQHGSKQQLNDLLMVDFPHFLLLIHGQYHMGDETVLPILEGHRINEIRQIGYIKAAKGPIAYLDRQTNAVWRGCKMMLYP